MKISHFEINLILIISDFEIMASLNYKVLISSQNFSKHTAPQNLVIFCKEVIADI